MERLIEALPSPRHCTNGEKSFRKAVNTAGKHNIPSGYRSVCSPAFPPEASRLAAERDQKRRDDPLDPEVARLNAEISSLVSGERRLRFNEFVNKSSPAQDPKAYFNLMRKLSGKRVPIPENQPISFSGRVQSDSKKIADGFCRQYTSIGAHDSRKFKDKRKIIKDLKINHPIDASYKPFTAAEVADAIRQSSSSTASGPDGITHLHLKHVGPKALQYLTDLYNLSVSKADIPAIWKEAVIVPILKPGKPVEVSSSYRPISLLSPCSKVLERLLLPACRDAFELSPN